MNEEFRLKKEIGKWLLELSMCRGLSNERGRFVRAHRIFFFELGLLKRALTRGLLSLGEFASRAESGGASKEGEALS